MKASINGVAVEGSVEEIKQLLSLEPKVEKQLVLQSMAKTEEPAKKPSVDVVGGKRFANHSLWWTNEDLTTLKNLWQSGKSSKVHSANSIVARQLGRKYKACQQALYKLNTGRLELQR